MNLNCAKTLSIGVPFKQFKLSHVQIFSLDLMSPTIAYFPDQWVVIETQITTKHEELHIIISITAVGTHHPHVQQPAFEKATSVPNTNIIVCKL